MSAMGPVGVVADADEAGIAETVHLLDQFAVATAIGLKLPGTRHSAERFNHCGVAGVDPADDIDDGFGHVVHLPSCGWASAGRMGEHDSDQQRSNSLHPRSEWCNDHLRARVD